MTSLVQDWSLRESSTCRAIPRRWRATRGGCSMAAIRLSRCARSICFPTRRTSSRLGCSTSIGRSDPTLDGPDVTMSRDREVRLELGTLRLIAAAVGRSTGGAGGGDERSNSGANSPVRQKFSGCHCTPRQNVSVGRLRWLRRRRRARWPRRTRPVPTRPTDWWCRLLTRQVCAASTRRRAPVRGASLARR